MTATDLIPMDAATAQPPIPTPAQYPVHVTGDALFPEDQYEGLPGLSDEAKHNIAGGNQPFMVKAVMLRQSDKYQEGQFFWFTVIVLSDHEFTTNFSAFVSKYNPDGTPVFEQYDRLARIAHALANGAKTAGPLTLEEVDTGKGNPFFKIKAYRPEVKVTATKR